MLAHAAFWGVLPSPDRGILRLGYEEVPWSVFLSVDLPLGGGGGEGPAAADLLFSIYKVGE